METTRIIHIGRKDHPGTGKVTLYIKNEPWGPIVTGATLAEAKEKFLRYLPVVMVANSFCEIERVGAEQETVENLVREKIMSDKERRLNLGINDELVCA